MRRRPKANPSPHEKSNVRLSMEKDYIIVSRYLDNVQNRLRACLRASLGDPLYRQAQTNLLQPPETHF